MALNPNLMLSVEQPDGVPVAITLAALAATTAQDGNAVTLVEAMASRRITVADVKAGRFAAGTTIPPALGAWPDSAMLAAADVQAALSSGPAPYVASAVNTDGTAWVSRAAALASLVDSFYGVLSLWTKVNTIALGQTDIVCSQPANNLNLFNQEDDHGLEMTLQDASGNAIIAVQDNPAIPFDDTWHHTLIAWNTDFAAGSRLVPIYIDGAFHSVVPFGTDVGVAYKTALAAETAWGIMGGGTGDVVAGDYADVAFYQGLNIVQPDGSIDADDLANFISSSGKPVNPATAVAAYGPPAILLSGDVTHFPINQGSGGAFVVNGTLTNATTSPST